MIKEVESKEMSVLEQAKAELKNERAKEAKVLLKEKLKELAEATTVVDNIKRELEDLEEKIEQGNF